MSLITRCPACGTMFKVVADQLKVSQGWVRCGHCAEVFDAATHLLPREFASMAPLAVDTAALAPDATLQEVSLATPVEKSVEIAPQSHTVMPPKDTLVEPVLLKPAMLDVDDTLDSVADFDPARWKLVQHDDGALKPMQEIQAVHSGQDSSAASANLPPHVQTLVHTVTPEESVLASQVAPQVNAANMEKQGESESSEFDALTDVSFVRDARRKAFWTRPLVRRSMAALSVLLLALLALQWMVQQKDSLVARDSRLAPLVQTVCSALGCNSRSPRHIDSLVIDSSSFNRLGPDAYRLNFSLKNIAAAALQIPSLEVTLTDAQDQALVRRVLEPGLFGARSNMLAAHAELAGAVTMKVSTDGSVVSIANEAPLPTSAPAAPLRVAGYRVLAFYP
jgi:predicted Zn finger-like uncharacterized protein